MGQCLLYTNDIMGKNYLRTIAGDLLNLEVNTIIKENTSSAKMPGTRRVALLKIAEQYRDYMIDRGFAKKAPGSNYMPRKGEKTLYFRWRYGGEFSFNEIRILARDAAKELSKRIAYLKDGEERYDAEKQLQMLVRIQEKSSNLIGLFKMRRKEYEVEIQAGQEGFSEACEWGDAKDSDYQPFPPQISSVGWNNDIDIQAINEVEDIELTPEHITLIRKVWEIGLEQVLLQTTIQIDGDITSILAKDFIYMPRATQDMIMRVHEDSISSSSKIWKMLFETIGNLAGKGFNKIFDRKAK